MQEDRAWTVKVEVEVAGCDRGGGRGERFSPVIKRG